MVQKEILKQFGMYFPDIARQLKTWFPNEKHSVRIRTTNDREFIFTYNGEKDWILETADSYIKKMKGK